jgi:hypothetical protein
VPFEGCGRFDQPWKIQAATVKFVEGGEHSDANGGTAAKASGWWNDPPNDQSVGLTRKATGLVIGVDDFSGKGVGYFGMAGFHGNVVVQVECEAEGIKSRA